MLLIETNHPTETELLGQRLAAFLEPGMVVALSGDLAAGKTTLIKGICDGLGVSRPAESPTFTLINEYQGRMPVYHLDCYRESRIKEWLELGINEYFYGAGVTLVEWADRISSLLPEDSLRIKIQQDTWHENYRRIEFAGPLNLLSSLSTQMQNQSNGASVPC